ncbi:hypothetical protein TREMEDRAFT_65169 [Tremella mesenterica DSM 1558]|uniref:uncharacterized protein n=1 Tax=Tremella mesenterica (strain ATCC 24925 / CBS 8224 / DSM 1558 / NBRC 9311 / NRRL Y-6157 / RJB 2259-6 / UBC 559-6) TaxID=578456 RepID=UPI00032CC411|nr:uncharacterized protein TREMEDRAFT_65169 [Tremella mesenterica DSM 1558]EIW66769.1 hypothetical protein TREMEDRAFT_65169 [Tremella mesenterica DSM 1558]
MPPSSHGNSMIPDVVQRDETTTTGGALSPSNFIQSAKEHFNVSGTSILVAWGLTAVASLIIILLFSRWRLVQKPDYELIYLPRAKACARKERLRQEGGKKEKQDGIWSAPVPPLNRTFFGWLKPAWKDVMIDLQWVNRSEAQKERNKQLLDDLGLDAFTYIQFLRLLRWLFLTLSIVVAMPLVTANYLINTSTQYSDYTVASTTSNLTSAVSGNSTALLTGIQLLTAANIQGNALLVHIGFEGIATCIVGVFFMQQLWRHGASVERWRAMNYAEVSFKTVFLTHLNVAPTESVSTGSSLKEHFTKPKKRRIVLEAQQIIRKRLRYAGNLDQSNVWFPLHDVGRLADETDEYVKEEFERVNTLFYMHQVRDLKNPMVDAPRIFTSFWAKVMRRHSRLEEAVEVALTRQKKLNESRSAILNGNKYFAPQGMMKDTAELKRSVTHAFVSVPAVDKAQALSAQSLKDPGKSILKGVKVELAPRPRTIIWRNLERSEKSKLIHAWIGRGIFLVIIILNCVPLMVIQWLANPAPLIAAWPWLDSKTKENPVYLTVLNAFSGAMSASVSGIFYLILPYGMRRLSRWSGALYRGQLDKDVIRGLFNFLLISNFVIFSLLGVLYSAYTAVNTEFANQANVTVFDYLKAMAKVPTQVTNAYISESSYWLSWFPMHAAIIVLQLLQLPAWAMQIYQLYIRGVETPQAWEEAIQPATFEYAIEYSQHLFAMVVGLVYAPLAPLVTVCCTVYFWTASIVHTHQLTYVEDTKETDGQAWNVVMNRVLVGLGFMQLLMLLTVLLKTNSISLSVAASLPILLTLLFTYLVRIHRPKKTNISTRSSSSSTAPNYLPEFLGSNWQPQLTIVNATRVRELFDKGRGNWGSEKKFGGTVKMVGQLEKKVGELV